MRSYLEKIAVGAAGDIHLGLVSDPVRYRSDGTGLLGFQMTDETRKPARRHERIVVQQNENITAGVRNSLVGGTGKSKVLGVENRANARVLLRKLPKIIDRAIG